MNQPMGHSISNSFFESACARKYRLGQAFLEASGLAKEQGRAVTEHDIAQSYEHIPACR